MLRRPLLLGRVVIRSVSYKSEVRERVEDVEGGDMRNLYDLIKESTSESAGCVMGAHARHTCPLCSCLTAKVGAPAAPPTAHHMDLVVALRILDHTGLVARHCTPDELLPLKRFRMSEYVTQGCERPAVHCSDEVYTTLARDMLPDSSVGQPTSLTSAVHSFVGAMEAGEEGRARSVLEAMRSLPASKLGISLAFSLCWLEGCLKSRAKVRWLKLLCGDMNDEEGIEPLRGLLHAVQSTTAAVFVEQMALLPVQEALSVLANRARADDLSLWKDACARGVVETERLQSALAEVQTPFLLSVLAPACMQWGASSEMGPKGVCTVIGCIAAVLSTRLPNLEGATLSEELLAVEILEFIQGCSRPLIEDQSTPLYPVDVAQHYLQDTPHPPEEKIAIKQLNLTNPISERIMATVRENVTSQLNTMLLKGIRLHITKKDCNEIKVLRRLCRDRTPVASSHSSILRRLTTCVALDDVGELMRILNTDLSPSRVLPSNSIAILKQQISTCPADTNCYSRLLEALSRRLIPVSVPRSMWDDMWTFVMVLDSERGAGKISDAQYRQRGQDILYQLLLSATLSLLSIRVVFMGILFLGYYSGKSTEGWLIRRVIHQQRETEEVDDAREVVFESRPDGPRPVVVSTTLYDCNPNSLLRDLSMQLRYSLSSLISACFFLYPIYSPSVQKYVIKSVCDRSDTTVMLHLAGGVQLDAFSRDKMVELFGQKCRVVVTAVKPPPPPPAQDPPTELVPLEEGWLRKVVRWVLVHC